MRIACMIGTPILAALLMGSVAAQPPTGRLLMGGRMAPHQMMGMMQRMAAMLNQMAALLRAGQLTPDQQTQMADLMVEMAEIAQMAEVTHMMDRLNTIVSTGGMSSQLMMEMGMMLQEMGKQLQQMVPQQTPLQQ